MTHCREAPVSTFDGTLIDDMSFGTLMPQDAGGGAISTSRADKGTICGMAWVVRILLRQMLQQQHALHRGIHRPAKRLFSNCREPVRREVCKHCPAMPNCL